MISIRKAMLFYVPVAVLFGGSVIASRINGLSDSKPCASYQYLTPEAKVSARALTKLFPNELHKNGSFSRSYFDKAGCQVLLYPGDSVGNCPAGYDCKYGQTGRFTDALQPQMVSQNCPVILRCPPPDCPKDINCPAMYISQPGDTLNKIHQKLKGYWGYPLANPDNVCINRPYPDGGAIMPKPKMNDHLPVGTIIGWC